MDCSPPGSSSMEFPRQEYWSGLPFLLQGIFPTQGLNPGLPHVGKFFTIEPPLKSQTLSYKVTYVIDLPLTLKNCVIENECYSYFHVMYSIPLPSKKKKKSKRHIEEKATALWIYKVRVSLVFRVRVWGFCFNAFLRVKLSSFLLLYLRLPESSVNKCVLSLFPIAGLGEDSEWWVRKISSVKYIHSLE